MAGFSVSGLDELILSMEEMANLPDDEAFKMLKAEADIVEPAQLAKGKELGVYDSGQTLTSMTRKSSGTSGGSKKIDITFEGVNDDGNRNAEVAFVNEYGVPSRGIAPRQFIRIANEEAADEAVEAAADVYDKWLESLGL